jgi:hypothetical protein
MEVSMRTTTLSAAVHVAIIVFTLSVPARVVARPAQPARMLQFTADVADERGDECRGAEQGRRIASSPYGSTHGEAPRTLPPGPKRGGVVPGGRHEGDGRGLDDLNACMDATVEDGWLMGRCRGWRATACGCCGRVAAWFECIKCLSRWLAYGNECAEVKG